MLLESLVTSSRHNDRCTHGIVVRLQTSCCSPFPWSQNKMIRLLDVPALQFLKEIVDLARLAPQERVRVAEQTVAVPGPLILEGVVEEVNLRVHVRIFERICEQIVEATVSQVAEQFFAPFVAVPRPENLKGSVHVLRLVLRVQTSPWIFEHIVELPVPPVAKQFLRLVSRAF